MAAEQQQSQKALPRRLHPILEGEGEEGVEEQPVTGHLRRTPAAVGAAAEGEGAEPPHHQRHGAAVVEAEAEVEGGH